MGRYLFKYAYASIVHNDTKIETNTFFAVAGIWKHVIQNNIYMSSRLSWFKECWELKEHIGLIKFVSSV